MSNPKLQRRIEEMKDANAELARRTAALAEQNDRLETVLGPEPVRRGAFHQLQELLAEQERRARLRAVKR